MGLVSEDIVTNSQPIVVPEAGELSQPQLAEYKNVGERWTDRKINRTNARLGKGEAVRVEIVGEYYFLNRTNEKMEIQGNIVGSTEAMWIGENRDA